MAHSIAVVAGLPPEVRGWFETAFSTVARDRGVELTLFSTRKRTHPYTREYARGVYDDLVCKLKRQGSATRESLLAGTRLFVLFLSREDESHSFLYERLGIEAFLTPLVQPEVFERPLETRAQRRGVANELIREARRALRHAQSMLAAICEEMSNRESKTCLLLPPKTFGSEFEKVQRCVWDAARKREDAGKFVRSLRALPLARNGKHYQGSGELVFKAPSKAGPRHGLPPTWEESHESTCVIRGRLRFGASFDPHFHYDCPLDTHSNRRFPGCHQPVRLPTSQTHVNCAPNDRVR